MTLTIKSKIPLSDGNQLPVFGLGTWMAEPKVVKEAVKCSVKAGYLLIDAARVYNNEEGVGEALEELFGEGYKREDIFVVTKLWNTHHRPEHSMNAIKQSLSKLKLTYVDLYLIHWPVSYTFSDEVITPTVDGKTSYDDTDLRDVWRGMEEIKKSGLAKSIGISNFNERQIDYILETAIEKPVVNQIESSPEFPNTELINFCKGKNIQIMAYSPLGNPGNPSNKGLVSLLDKEFVKKVAEKHKKTTAQICLRFALDRGLNVIPKSGNLDRIRENADIFDFSLSQEEIDEIIKNSPHRRTCRALETLGAAKEYPFNKD